MKSNRLNLYKLTSPHNVPEEFRVEEFLSPWHCPKCGKRGTTRSGAEFEHMEICHKCNIVWTPSAVEEIQSYIKRIENV